MIVLLIVISGLSYFGFNSLSTAAHDQYFAAIDENQWAQLRLDLSNEANSYYIYCFTKDAKDLQDAELKSANVATTADMLSRMIEAQTIKGENLQTFNTIMAAHQEWLNKKAEVFQSADNGKEGVSVLNSWKLDSAIIIGKLVPN